MPSRRFTHALVVGAGGALGSAVVAELARRGTAVSAAGRTAPPAGQVRRFVPVETARADWPAVLAEVDDGAEPLDAVVYVSGLAVLGETRLIPLAEAREVFEVSFWAPAAAALAAAERWSAAGRRGTFLAVLSLAGRRAIPNEAYYGAAKAAAARYLDVLHLEYGGRGIRVCAAYPGLIKTPFRDRSSWHGERPPESGYGAQPEETARALADLLEERRWSSVFGWRERAIDLADRLAPGLYDRLVLSRRVKR